MIEVAADKSTCGAYGKAPKGKGMPPKGCLSGLPPVGSAWGAGKYPADCRASCAESYRDSGMKYVRVMISIMTRFSYFRQRRIPLRTVQKPDASERSIS